MQTELINTIRKLFHTTAAFMISDISSISCIQSTLGLYFLSFLPSSKLGRLRLLYQRYLDHLNTIKVTCTLGFWYPYSSVNVFFSIFLCIVAVARCLKITGKVSFNIASEASYIYSLSGQKLIKNAKNGLFWRFFENLKLAVKQCYQIGQF